MADVRSVVTLTCGALTVALCLAPRADAGQAAAPVSPASGIWEIEVHAGGMRASNQTRGTSTLPPAGVTFNTINVLPTRRVSSWFFGDGAVLFNQANAALGLPGRITPIDAVLASRGTRRESRAAFGARAARYLTSRLAAEFSLDIHLGSIGLAPGTREAIDASVASFRSAWVDFLNSRPDVFRTPFVLADAQILDASGGQVFATGAATFDLLTHARVTPYVTAGAGLVVHHGREAEIELVGTYRSHFSTGSVFDEETDEVRIRYSVPDRQALWLLGGGVKGNVRPSWGWRLDVRMHVSSSATRVRLDAEPARLVRALGAAFATGTTPGLQFSSLSSVTPTLSGQSIVDFETFAGSGRELQTSITAGVIMRFGAGSNK